MTPALHGLVLSGLACLGAGEVSAGGRLRPLEVVRICADTLIAKGTDRYGPVHRPFLMAILDARTLSSPEDPLPLDERVRVQRRGRRGPRGSNLWLDQPTLRAFYALSRITGDGKYRDFADRYLRAFTGRQVDPEKGLFQWGWHIWYDAYEDRPVSSHGRHHEIHVHRPLWDDLWRVAPEATRREIEAIWKWHIVDEKTGESNRHGDGRRGLAFAMSQGEFIYAFAFLYSRTRDPAHLRWARAAAAYHWDHRDPRTNLAPDAPGQSRWDAVHAFTSVPGLLAYFLLKAEERTGEKRFRDQALAYLRAYARYGYDPEEGEFWGMLRLDGTPVRGPRPARGYEANQPRGHLDVWEPYVLGYAHPLRAAQTYIYAYRQTRDPDLLEASRRWARQIRVSLPAGGGEGTYAEKYGRAISFFLALEAATGDPRDLATAREIAADAVAKLRRGPILVGHPHKPYYEAVDGVGFLLYALLELDVREKGLGIALEDNF